MTPTIASHISETATIPASATVAGPSVPYGAVYTIPATENDRALMVLDTNGVLLGGPQRELGATDELVEQLAGEGPLEVRYVGNESGGTLARGLALTRVAASGANSAAVAGINASAAALLGVAKFDILDDVACFVAKSGVVIGVVGAAGATVDTPLKVDAAGKFTDASAGDDVVAYALATGILNAEIRILLSV